MVQRAERIADDIFFPGAVEVDRTGHLPRGWLDLLATEGFYGVAALAVDGDEVGEGEGGEGNDRSTAGAMIEAFAGGCLSAAFVWIQHHGTVIAVERSNDAALRERWIGPLARGHCRAGIALAGARPGPEQVRVRATDRGWAITGDVPWVTGWDVIDVVQVAAVDERDVVHFLLVDVAPAPSLKVTRTELVCVQASSTVEIGFRDHLVPRDRLISTATLADWTAANASGSALNGHLALGVARRCARLMGTTDFDAELTRCRVALTEAEASGVPAARTDASLLAHRTAAALAVQTGSRAALAGSHAERLLREAGFLLVFGSRPAIRDTLLERLSRHG
jgi:alkylation response protein AidB-like acyl-CoA dehydrogenase